MTITTTAGGSFLEGSRLPLLMAVLNVTPDSFSDGGTHADPVERGQALLGEGADIIDVGGESTRPGAIPVDAAEEQRRVLPVIEALAKAGARISVDTRHASTMIAALNAGAWMVNDVSALAHDPASLGAMAARDCPVVLMHMRGTPTTMGGLAVYDDVVGEVIAELGACVNRAVAAGIARERIAIDPGLGFAKTPAQSVTLLRALPRIVGLGYPVLVGASRKGFIGALTDEAEPARRDAGSLAAALFAAAHGAAMVRVHDVAGARAGVRVWGALMA